MPYAQLGPIAIHLPARVETNEMLQQQYPRWDLQLIAEKTGIHRRHIAEPGETSSDLAVAAAGNKGAAVRAEGDRSHWRGMPFEGGETHVCALTKVVPTPVAKLLWCTF